MADLCIIPARGGSKRIPRKNIKDFLGKPVIAYSIQAALGSGLFSEVMVSTDDAEIAGVALEYGAKVPFMRSEKNADDHATTFDVVEEVINAYREAGRSFLNICCIYPCAPLVSAQHITAAYRRLTEEGLDSVFPVMAFSFPIQRALKMNGPHIEPLHREFVHTRSQDLEPRYHDAGQFYWAVTEALLKHRTFLMPATGGMVISETEAQDIDTMSDWHMAELKYTLQHGISG